jgi:hypothetical protein
VLDRIKADYCDSCPSPCYVGFPTNQDSMR